MPAAEAMPFAERLLADADILMIGLGARDSLRLEAGLALYGQDLDEETDPRESGSVVGRAEKPSRTAGRSSAPKRWQGTLTRRQKRKRIGLAPAQPVRADAPILDADGRKIGRVTSGGFGPTVNRAVALARIDADAAPPFFAEVRGRKVAAEVANVALRSPIATSVTDPFRPS